MLKNIVAATFLCFLHLSFKCINFRCEHNEITSFKVLGERCSGTNYLEKLIEKNLFIKNNLSSNATFGHKHFIWWIGSEISDKDIQSMIGNGFRFNPCNFFFQNSDNNLFIIIIRDPYDWIRSWYKVQHHIKDPIKRIYFRSFYGTPYTCNSKYGTDSVSFLEDYHPELKRGFNNLFELRKYKYLNYEKLFSIVKNVIFINYEAVCANPKQFIDMISETYSIQKNSEFIDVITWKGSKNTPYKKKEYFPLKLHDLQLINSLIDWDQENRYGYTQNPCK